MDQGQLSDVEITSRRKILYFCGVLHYAFENHSKQEFTLKMNQAVFARLRMTLSVLTAGAIIAAGLVSNFTASSQTRVKRPETVTSAEQPEGNPVAPLYQIYDIGVVQAGDSASQGFGVSTGGVAVGRSIRTGAAQAFSWTQGGGITGLPNLAGRPFCVSNSANNSGTVAGTCATTLFGTSRLPVIWQNGAVSQLPMPAGETLGDANHVNATGVAVGSVNGGSLQKAVYYSGGTATYISQTTANGSFFITAFGVNDAGRIVGQGIDPTNAARNVGIVYDIGAGSATEVGALPGFNGALAFAVGNGGHVVGSSMLNQGSGLPFIWSAAGGMVAIPLAAGTTQGSARAVNTAGWAVGTDSSAFAIPFLYDGSSTYRLADMIPSGTGWDLSTNTSSAALGISDNNVIVGTGVLNGVVHAFAMVPVPISVVGRILTSNGAGISNARVMLSGGNLSSPKMGLTGGFGYYRFDGLLPGVTYTVTVGSKRFTFAQPSRTVTSNIDVTNFDFTALP